MLTFSNYTAAIDGKSSNIWTVGSNGFFQRGGHVCSVRNIVCVIEYQDRIDNNWSLSKYFKKEEKEEGIDERWAVTDVEHLVPLNITAIY